MRRAEGRGRLGFSLVEVLMAVVVIAVALGALLEVFSYSLKISIESARDTEELMGTYAQVQMCFYKEREFFDSDEYRYYDSDPFKLGAKGSGIIFASVPVDLELSFSHSRSDDLEPSSSHPSATTIRLPLKAYDMGKNENENENKNKPLRIYRLDPLSGMAS